MAAQTPMAPTDRSSPPVTITAIMARPIIVSMPIWRPMVNRLKGEVKPGSVTRKTVKVKCDEDQDGEAELVAERSRMSSPALPA
jgi:hypothetical protein